MTHLLFLCNSTVFIIELDSGIGRYYVYNCIKASSISIDDGDLILKVKLVRMTAF